jgi:hypothetical protein
MGIQSVSRQRWSDQASEGASPNGQLARVRLVTAALTDGQIDEKIRVSAINGGGLNGAFARGTATYGPISEWKGRWPPKEIGILDGMSSSLCGQLAAVGGLAVESV